ncbi:hypothetical protein ES703_41435 [subsurface metagenome]
MRKCIQIGVEHKAKFNKVSIIKGLIHYSCYDWRFLGAAKFLWEVFTLEARYKVKWGGISSHGAIIKCLYPGVGMTGCHVEEGGLFINDIVMNTSRVCSNNNMVYLGIINELGGIGLRKVGRSCRTCTKQLDHDSYALSARTSPLSAKTAARSKSNNNRNSRKRWLIIVN